MDSSSNQKQYFLESGYKVEQIKKEELKKISSEGQILILQILILIKDNGINLAKEIRIDLFDFILALIQALIFNNYGRSSLVDAQSLNLPKK
ncbi:unnamed protein product [Paramecium sonneborni]|uniref:Uncharacterized protein n=1 Tax=Paramecium sonneborni TaxID=65129 RepID=A0A8S1RN45_9CILI|nr:unnamed protein product [Paramecium sonneborni]